ncbi:MAG: disulfide bond formation protein B [bacterium]
MNPDTVHYLNLFLGFGAILLQILSFVVLFLLFFYPRKTSFLDFIYKHSLPILFFVTFVASLFSLVYSDIINFLPCYLCWYQRVFMFPLVFIFSVAMWDKDKKAIKYTLPLACIGFAISVYQNFFYYFTNSSNVVCDVSGAYCYQHLVSEFGGYISIPMLALTVFVAVLTVILVTHFYKKEN